MHNSNTASFKECQHCGNDFIPRRSDAKFCTSKCRHDSGNLKKQKEREEYLAIVGETHKLFWKNRNILLKYVGKTVDFEILKSLGFKTNDITHFQKTEQGNNEFLIYDVWYQIFKSDSSFNFKIYQK